MDRCVVDINSRVYCLAAPGDHEGAGNSRVTGQSMYYYYFLLLILYCYTWTYRKLKGVSSRKFGREWAEIQRNTSLMTWLLLWSICLRPVYQQCSSMIIQVYTLRWTVNSSPLGQNDWHFADNIFRRISRIKKCINNSMKFVPEVPIDDKPLLI